MCHLAIWKYTDCPHSNNTTPDLFPCTIFNTNGIPCPSSTITPPPLYHDVRGKCHDCTLSELCKYCTMRSWLKRSECDCHIYITRNSSHPNGIQVPENFLGERPPRPPLPYNHEEFMAQNAPAYVPKEPEPRLRTTDGRRELKRWVADRWRISPRRRARWLDDEAGPSMARRRPALGGLLHIRTMQSLFSRTREMPGRSAEPAVPSATMTAPHSVESGSSPTLLRPQAKDASWEEGMASQGPATREQVPFVPPEVTMELRSAMDRTAKERQAQRVQTTYKEEPGDELLAFPEFASEDENVMRPWDANQAALLLDEMEREREREAERGKGEVEFAELLEGGFDGLDLTGRWKGKKVEKRGAKDPIVLE